jgi:hypothetical protein
MGPKKVWGIILIVLGVLAVIGGAANYRDLDLLGYSIHAFDASMAKTFGKYSTSALSGVDVHGIIYREKVLSIIGLLIGISLSVIGTMMIKRTQPEPVFDIEDEFEVDPDKEPSFKF